MVEIAVDLMSIHNTAQNANALNEKKPRIQHRLKDEKNKETSILDAFAPWINLCICNHKSADNPNIQLNNQPKQAATRILLTISLEIYNPKIYIYI